MGKALLCAGFERAVSALLLVKKYRFLIVTCLSRVSLYSIIARGTKRIRISHKDVNNMMMMANTCWKLVSAYLDGDPIFILQKRK